MAVIFETPINAYYRQCLFIEPTLCFELPLPLEAKWSSKLTTPFHKINPPYPPGLTTSFSRSRGVHGVSWNLAQPHMLVLGDASIITRTIHLGCVGSKRLDNVVPESCQIRQQVPFAGDQQPAVGPSSPLRSGSRRSKRADCGAAIWWAICEARTGRPISVLQKSSLQWPRAWLALGTSCASPGTTCAHIATVAFRLPLRLLLSSLVASFFLSSSLLSDTFKHARKRDNGPSSFNQRRHRPSAHFPNQRTCGQLSELSGTVIQPGETLQTTRTDHAPFSTD